MNRIDTWLDKRSFRNVYTLIMGVVVFLGIAFMIFVFLIGSSEHDAIVEEYVAELEAQKDFRGQELFQYYNKLSPAMRAYLYDLQNYKYSAHVQYVRYFGWENRDVLIGIEHNVVNDTYYGIWGINGSPDYNLERGESLTQDVFIYVVE